MVPDNESSKTVGDFYVWDDGKKDWIKLEKLSKCESISKKESICNRFWRKIRSILKRIR